MRDLRLFLAIDIPNSARGKITEVQSRYKTLNLDATWVKPSHIHLTLKFLGNTHPDLIPAIKDRMEKIAGSSQPFPISCGKVGVFPNASRPRVLWVGLENGEDHLSFLKIRVEKEMASLGFPLDKKKPVHHLTLARIKSGKNKESLKQALQSSQPIEMDPFEVSSLQLIKSELTPKGSIYTVQEEFVFTG